MRRFFAVKRIVLILQDIFVEQVNHEEKNHADSTNRHILEKMNREEKDSAVSFQSINKESSVRLQTLYLVD